MQFKETLLNQALSIMQSSGVFLSSGNNPPDVMTLNWGALGKFWNTSVMVVPIRYNHYSNELVHEHHEFCISVPRRDMLKTLNACTEISGRDCNKFEVLRLHASKCRNIDTYYVADCDLHLECKVIYRAGMEHFQLINEKVKTDFYTTKNYHSMFFAEIVDMYET